MRGEKRTDFMADHGPAHLRAELRDLMREHLPEGWLGPFTTNPADLAISKEFCRVLADRGLLVPEWPEAYGGRAAPLDFGIVVREEMWANNEPRGPQYYGPNWVGPSIMHHGTDAQRSQHLPAITAGEVVWCQGFSEPEAGSDLASLRTRATPHAGGWVVNGQKIWTSWAGWANWCYLLARVVDDDGPSGITVFLVPMDRLGISVRPIDGIPGPEHLNEVFFDDVLVASDEVLGEVGGGWDVVRDALANERVGISRYARSDRALALLTERIEKAGQVTPSLHARWVQARVRNRVARLMCRYALERQQHGGADDYVVSAARLLTTRGDQEVADLASDTLADGFFDDRHSGGAPFGGLFEFIWRYSQAATIASGTTEVLQILLSRRLFKGDRLPVSEDALDLADALSAAFGADEPMARARAAREAPGSRKDVLATFRDLVSGLDPREGMEEAVLAAEVCRAAGKSMLPVPVEAVLMAGEDGVPFTVASATGRVEHGDLCEEWRVVSLSGGCARATDATDALGTRLGPFVTTMSLEWSDDIAAARDVALSLTLTSWYVLGALESALGMAIEYAQQREQFGAAIGTNQGVAFPLADASAEVQGLARLADHTIWRLYHAPASAMTDALALRWAALEAARRVLRICHQVHGAIGLCDEHDLYMVTTGLQARLRMPIGIDETLAALGDPVVMGEFDSIHTPRPGE